jgi:hypothetical protein
MPGKIVIVPSASLASGRNNLRRVGGHGKIPIDGQLISPLAVTKTPH